MSMTRIRISNNIGTSTNEYPSDGLQITVIRDGQETVAYVDGQLGAPAKAAFAPRAAAWVDPQAVKRPIEGEGGGKGSVILQALTGGWAQTDAAGNLVNRDGSLFTQATPNDPWPSVCDSVEALLQFQFDHNNRPDQIYVDGVKFGQPGTDPGVRYGSAANPGKLTLEFSPPVGVKVIAPVATASEPSRITIAPPVGHQVDVVLNGPSIVTLTDIPAPTVPGRMGFVRLTDMAGEQMPTGVVSVLDAKGTMLYSDYANGFGFDFATDGPGASPQAVIPGESLTIEALGLSGPVLLSYRTPAW